ncbi:MAG: bifunctional DNA primase/polymerase, partial [Dehalococcoidia bacterium]
MNLILESALDRARKGALVLPLWWTNEGGACQCPKGANCPSPGKHPRTKHGLDDASSDPSTIEGWWKQWPDANIGERTDFTPRIDIDLTEVADALANDIALPQMTQVVRTPRGGMHIAFACARPIEGRVLSLRDGRRLGELKGARGYVLVPPSAVGKHRYVMVSPPDAVPSSLNPLDWLRQTLPLFGFELGRDRSSQREYEHLGGVIYEGEGRHNALVSLAGRLWVDGMAPAALTGSLRAVNETQCRPPLPDEELAAIGRHFIETRQQSSFPQTTAAVRTAQIAPPIPSQSRLAREDVVAAFSKWLHLPDMEAIDVLMATAIAIYLPGDPLWLYYVGPPGATKTEPLRALSGPRVMSLSSLTPQTLISGYKGDPSKVDLLPKLDGKLLIVKDFTSILSKKPDDAAAIFADLREAYDGYLEKSYGSGVGTKGYSARFGLIAAVTPALDRFRTVHSLLGERFLRIDLHTDAQATIQRASELEGQENEMRAELRSLVSGYLHAAGEWVDPDILVEQRFLDQLRALAHVTATLRTEVDRDRQRLVLYQPVPEVGTRLVKQLQKLAKALANWRERMVVTAEDYVTVRRVALDCVRSQRRKVVGVLQSAEGAAILTADVGSLAGIPSDTLREICEDLWQLGVVKRSGEQHAGW